MRSADDRTFSSCAQNLNIHILPCNTWRITF